MAEDTVLVAVDGSSAAQAAARVAIQIAAAEQMAIHGLYVVDEALALDNYARPEQELGVERGDLSRSDLIGAFETQGNQALEWLESEAGGAGVPVRTELLAGGVPEMILRQAEGARLLALGRRGNTHANEEDVLGRYFVNIAHRAHVPLLVGAATSRPIHRLLLAYNHDGQTGQELAWAASLGKALAAQQIVLFVDADLRSDRAQQAVSDIKVELAASALLDYQLVVAQGEPATEIAAAAEENGVDLIVMGRYRHGTLVEWLLGSPVDRVLRATPLPVLLA